MTDHTPTPEAAPPAGPHPDGCPGCETCDLATQLADERAAHEAHRRQLADALRINPERLRDWDETIKAARDIAKLREGNQQRFEQAERAHEAHRGDLANALGNDQPTPDEPARCVCGDPIQRWTGPGEPGWIHSPGSDTTCTHARPRCTCAGVGFGNGDCAVHYPPKVEPEPEAPCFHPSWQTEPTVGARKCTDCGEWLDPQPPAPAELDGAALWAAIRDHAFNDTQWWRKVNQRRDHAQLNTYVQRGPGHTPTR